MLEFEIDAKLLQRVLNATAVVIEDPTLVFGKGGMSVVSFDEARVAMIQLGLKKSEFETYDIGGEKAKKISFDVGLLASYLGGADGVAMLTVVKHQIELMIPSKYGFRTFEVPLLADTGTTMVPKLKYDSQCKLDLGGLQLIVRDAEKVKAENVYFKVGNDDLDVILKGEKGSGRSSLELGKGIISSQFTTQSKFIISLGWLKDAMKVGNSFTHITKFEFSEKLYPCKFSFQVPFDGHLYVYVAPILLEEVYGKEGDITE